MDCINNCTIQAPIAATNTFFSLQEEQISSAKNENKLQCDLKANQFLSPLDYNTTELFLFFHLLI